MRLKRLAPGTIFLVFGVLTLPTPAAAQLSGGEWRLPATSTGQRAVETKPQPQIIVQRRHDSRYPETVFRRQPMAYTLVPAMVMSDGSVYANFGYGFEPVYRSCSGGVVVGQPTTVVAGNGVVLNPQAPTYTQPVPNQQTASQQMLSVNRTGQAVNRTQYASCYSRDPYGRVSVYRF
jgi:hypothetical protein